MDEEGIFSDDILNLAKQFEEDCKSQELHYYSNQSLEDLIYYYLDNSEFHMAMQASELGMRQHPYDANFYGKCAHIHNINAEYAKALSVIDKGLSIEPAHTDNIILKAETLEFLKRYDDARFLYDLALDYGADPDEIRLGKAHNLIGAGKGEEGLALVHEIFRKEIESDHIFYEAMMFFEQTETWEFAAEILEEYIDMDPYSVIAWSSLGHIHGENGDFEKAVWAYDYAITIEDDFGEAHLQKGFCLSELGKFKEAAVAFRAYIELDSPDAMAFTSIGDCFRAIDQFDEAESYYRSALQIDPKYTEAWFGLGMISAVKEKDEDAFKFFKKALEFGPENDYYLLQMIQVLMKMKYWSQAETFLLELVNKRRLHQSAWIWLAESQFEQNKVNEAIDTLAVWLDIDPEDDVALYYVSAYYFIQGDVKNANDYLCEALLLNPDNVQVLFDIAPFLKDVRQVNDVIDLYKNELS